MSQKHRRKLTSLELRITNGRTTYQMGSEIGRGGFGLVFNALNMETGDFVAVKRVSLENIDEESMSQLQMEIELLKKLNHPNIVKYIDTIKTDDFLHIVLEYMENGSLSHVIKKFGNFSESLTAIYITQVLTGLAYLHEQGVLHRDIKGANILTAKDGQVKLADFGVAMKTNDPSDEVDVVGTPYWMAPEIIEMSAPTAACDVWSVGCVVLELLTGKPPYYDLAPMTALFRIVQDEFPPLPDGISEALRDFLMNTFKKEPFMRKSAVDLLEHPWLKNPKTHVSKVVQTFVQQNEGLEHEKESTMVVNTIKLFSIQQLNQKGEYRKSASAWDQVQSVPTSPISANGGEKTIKLRRGMNPRNGPEVPSPIVTTRPSPVSRHHSNSNESESEDMSWADFDEAEGGLVKIIMDSDRNNDPSYLDKLTPRSTPKPPGKEQASPGATTPRIFGTPSENSRAHPIMRLSLDDSNSSGTDRSSGSTRSSRSMHARKTSMISDEMQSAMRAVYGDVSLSNDMSNSEPKHGKGLWNSLKEIVSCLQPDETLGIHRSCSSDNLFQNVDVDRNELESALLEMDNTISLHKDKKGLVRLPTTLSDSMYNLKKFADKESDEDFGDIDIPEDGLSAALRPRGVRETSDSAANDGNIFFDDPFGNDTFEEPESKQIQEREVLKRLSNEVKRLLLSLEDSMPEEEIAALCLQVLECFEQQPALGSQIIQDHGVIPILRMINIIKSEKAVPSIFQILNKIIEKNAKGQEYLSMLGLIPPIIKFAKKDHQEQISQGQLEASKFIDIICGNARTLQMFIGCGGLEILVNFVGLCTENNPLARKLVHVGVKGILQIFKLSVIRRNDFCKLLADAGFLPFVTSNFDTLVNRLLKNSTEIDDTVLSFWEDLHTTVEIIENFSKSVKVIIDLISKSTLIQTLVQAFPKIFKTHARSNPRFANLLVQVLKCLKNMALDPQIMDLLEESGVIGAVMPLLERRGTPCDDAYEASIIYLFFCLCRLKKSRQEAAAQNGIVPHLVRVIKEQKSTKQFALHVVCDLAHTSPATRRKLAQSKVVELYISLLRVRGQQIVANWQNRALECLAVWMNSERQDVENMLCQSQAIDNVTWALRTLQQDDFEKFSESLLDLLMSSEKVAKEIGKHEEFVHELVERLQYPKARVCTNLLKILRVLYENAKNKGKFVQQNDLETTIIKLAADDGKVVVQKLASKLLEDFSCI